MLQHKKLIYSIAAFVLIAAILLGVYYFVVQKDDTKNVTQPQTPVSTKYSPPTEEELKSVDQNKEKLAKDNTNTSTGAQATVQPVITSASASEVRSFVPGIVEDNGTCTATFTKGTATFTKTSKGFGNVSNTNCEPISLSATDFSSKGTWSVVITYDSTGHHGSSQSSTVEVN